MKRKRNDEVVQHWAETRSAVNHTETLRTDGIQLWSYKLLIGDTCRTTGMKILRDYTARGRWGFKSQTTSCHVGRARIHADILDT